MNKTITFTIILLVSVTSSAQIVPSSCDAPDSIKSLYLEDAKNAAFDKIYSLELSERDSLFIDVKHTDTILRALIAVYNAVDLKSRDSVIRLFRIHHYSSPMLTVVDIAADSNIAWMDSFRKNAYPTGNGFIDTLYSAYGARFHEIGPIGNVMWGQLRFPTSVNVKAVQKRLTSIQEVEWSNVLGAGDGSKITHTITKDFVEIIYKYQWGDCPSGCQHHRSWTFRVYQDCSVEFVDSDGDADTPVLKTKSIQKTPIQIFPNPFEEFLIITGPIENIDFQIFSLDGRLIIEGKSQNMRISNLDNLNPGNYIVHVRSENKSTSVIMIKK
jgi:hypothetical protein